MAQSSDLQKVYDAVEKFRGSDSDIVIYETIKAATLAVKETADPTSKIGEEMVAKLLRIVANDNKVSSLVRDGLLKTINKLQPPPFR